MIVGPVGQNAPGTDMLFISGAQNRIMQVVALAATSNPGHYVEPKRSACAPHLYIALSVSILVMLCGLDLRCPTLSFSYWLFSPCVCGSRARTGSHRLAIWP